MLVVVHLVDPQKDDKVHADLAALAVAQSRVAFANGADGVFLIPAVGGLAPEVVHDVYARVRAVVGPDAFIGINWMSNDAATKEAGPPPGANALWTDSGVDLRGEHRDAKTISTAIETAVAASRPWFWFAGFLFKGKSRTFEDFSDKDEASPEERLRLVARAVSQLTKLTPASSGPAGSGPPTGRIVLCTSGPGTGSPFELDRAKIYRKVVKEAVGADVAIAVASGVTADNVEELLPYVDIFMVATGVEAEPEDPVIIAFYKEAGIPCAKLGYLDPARVRALAEKIHPTT